MVRREITIYSSLNVLLVIAWNNHVHIDVAQLSVVTHVKPLEKVLFTCSSNHWLCVFANIFRHFPLLCVDYNVRDLIWITKEDTWTEFV